jgi:type IV pilus assembly protein PilE
MKCHERLTTMTGGDLFSAKTVEALLGRYRLSGFRRHAHHDLAEKRGVFAPTKKDDMKQGNQLGFTVIELMVALTIVCLLVAVAVASFQDHMTRKARNQARSALMEVAEGLRMQHVRMGSYQAETLPITQTPGDGDAIYRISLAKTAIAASDPKAVFPPSSAQAFTLQAVPVDEDACGTLLLDHTGRRGVLGPEAKLADCWPK